MRVLVFDPTLCTGCGVCESTCAQVWFKVSDTSKSSIHILQLAGPVDGFAARFCDQCGLCIDVCPTLALKRDKRGIVRIDQHLCVGCLSCVGFCPTLTMYTHADLRIPFKCVASGRCVKQCPEGALAIEECPDAPLTTTEKRMEVLV
jgi:carbon-monoxide dehydrogenase iron sulfur subunit